MILCKICGKPTEAAEMISYAGRCEDCFVSQSAMEGAGIPPANQVGGKARGVSDGKPDRENKDDDENY